jgi:hypothetical protein
MSPASPDPHHDIPFERALQIYLELIEQRVRNLYVLPRGLFAESIVAAAIDGTVVEFPSQAWDVEMNLPRSQRRVRIQVKYSGERKPQVPQGINPPQWSPVSAPQANRGPPPNFEHLGPGFHCEVFVFARHEGWALDEGWSFYVLPQKVVKRNVRVNPVFSGSRFEDELHVDRCTANELRARVIDAARRQGTKRVGFANSGGFVFVNESAEEVAAA